MSYTKGRWKAERTGKSGPGLIAFQLWSGEEPIIVPDTSGEALIGKPADAYLIEWAPETFEALAALVDKLESLGSDLPYIQEASDAFEVVEQVRGRLHGCP